MISTIEPKVFLNDKIAKKIFKNEKLGKKFSARIISDLIGADYEEVYNNIKLSSEEIAFSSLCSIAYIFFPISPSPPKITNRVLSLSNFTFFLLSLRFKN